jgi:hypothetical protein
MRKEGGKPAKLLSILFAFLLFSHLFLCALCVKFFSIAAVGPKMVTRHGSAWSRTLPRAIILLLPHCDFDNL